MKIKGHIILRRRLYEQVVVFEDFLLELERYILYNSDNQTLFEYVGSKQFEKRFKNQIISILCITELFVKRKIFFSEEDFAIEMKQIKQLYEKNFEEQFNLFLYHISSFVDSNTKPRLVELSRIINSNWAKDLSTIQQCFDNAELFHSILLEILESSHE
ncbi:MAG: hypothetical protein ACLFPL_01820 [Candidatus Nanoarchaeia archaeon]